MGGWVGGYVPCGVLLASGHSLGHEEEEDASCFGLFWGWVGGWVMG